MLKRFWTWLTKYRPTWEDDFREAVWTDMQAEATRKWRKHQAAENKRLYWRNYWAEAEALNPTVEEWSQKGATS